MNATCPCCKGAGYLEMYSDDNPPIKTFCCHCAGKGQIPDVRVGGDREQLPRENFSTAELCTLVLQWEDQNSGTIKNWVKHLLGRR